MTTKPVNSLRDLPDAELARLAGLRDGTATAETARAAFEVLHDRHAPRLVSFLAARRHPRRSIDDVLQNVWLNAWQAIPRFDGKHFAGWIFTIARNALNDQLRHSSASNLGEAEDSLADARSIDPSHRLLASEDQTILARCLGELNPEERLVVEAKLAGDDYDAITARTAISKKRAYKLFFNAMAKLKFCVERAER